MRLTVALASLVVATVALVAALAVQAGGPAAAAPRLDADDKTLVARGAALYATHCAACHGAQLQGQPEWRRPGPDSRLPAPPHDASGHTWHHGDDYLVRIVRDGFQPGIDRPPGYQGNMPAFGAVLSDADIVAVLSYIKSQWPWDHRAWQERATATEAPGGPPPVASPAPSAAYRQAQGDALLAASFKQFGDRTPTALRRYEGRPLVAYFWASWCKPCAADAKALTALAQEHAAAGLQVVAIGVDQSDRLQRYAKEHGLDVPVFVGGAEGIELSRRLGNLLGDMPFVAAIDRQGRLGAVHLGAFEARTPAAMARAALR